MYGLSFFIHTLAVETENQNALEATFEEITVSINLSKMLNYAIEKNFDY